MTAIIDDNFSKENLKSQIEKLNGVSSVTYISPKEAWNEFQKNILETLRKMQKVLKMIIHSRVLVILKLNIK